MHIFADHDSEFVIIKVEMASQTLTREQEKALLRAANRMAQLTGTSEFFITMAWDIECKVRLPGHFICTGTVTL